MNNVVDATDLHRKLAILADAAKYDASCASSGAGGRNSRDGKGLGSTTGSGICHAYTPDGRCVSLLKACRRISAFMTACFLSIVCRATRPAHASKSKRLLR